MSITQYILFLINKIVVSKLDHGHQSFWQTLKSILAAAVGVQSSKNHQQDFNSGNPKMFIGMGILFTFIFIGTLLLIVKNIVQ